MTEERIQKLLAQAGLGSRRSCEEYLVQHRVKVNGKLVELGAKADPIRDTITVDDRRIQFEQKVYVMLNKPIGIITTNEDEFDRKTVRDLVSIQEHLYPVGRLDADSEGLVLLTNDGDLANALTHPRYEHEKEYMVLVDGKPDERVLNAWRRGILLEDQMTAPARVEVIDMQNSQTWLRIIMHEGRKRQIREIGGMLGHKVKHLERVRIGPIVMGDLKSGAWRYLNPGEVSELRTIVDQAAKRKPVKEGRPRKPIHERTRSNTKGDGSKSRTQSDRRGADRSSSATRGVKRTNRK
jgi:23S rRNA pseudouridine2605 synthase